MPTQRSSSHSKSRAPRHAGRPATSRAPILLAARSLFLAHGFSHVSMDMIAAEAKVARRTLYHQFASKENVFRAVLTDLMQAIPAALLTEAEAERDLRVALTFLGRALAAHWRMPETVALNRMLIVESRRFPWMAKHHDQLGHAMLIRFVKALRREAQAGRIECPHPSLAARQFIGALAGVLLWPLVQGSERKPAFEPELVIAEAVEMFLLRYSKPGGSS